MSIRIENKETQRQNLVKDAFKQLISRLNARKTSPPRHNPSKIIKQKSQQYQKCRRYSAGFRYKPNQLSTQPNTRISINLSLNNTPTNLSQTCTSNWSKKDIASSRCKTQSRNKTLHSIQKRFQEKNHPLLIAKSFVIQQFQPRRTDYMSFYKVKKPKKEQYIENNFTQDHFRYKKNHKRQQQRMFNFRKAMKKKQQESIQFVRKDSNLQYQPWQVEQQIDIF